MDFHPILVLPMSPSNVHRICGNTFLSLSQLLGLFKKNLLSLQDININK